MQQEGHEAAERGGAVAHAMETSCGEERKAHEGPAWPTERDDKSGIGARWFAWLLSLVGPAHDRALADRKARLLGGLRGTVVEIGPGVGINLEYYRPVCTVVGIEPNPWMLPRYRERVRSLGVPARLVRGDAARLPLREASVDAVVSTVVLCSVADPGAVLGEIRRVLRHGGRFVFIEHVAAPRGSWLRRLQRWIRPLWRRLGDGCNPDRETGALIGEAGFASVDLEEFEAALPLPVVRPHIAGSAMKGAG